MKVFISSLLLLLSLQTSFAQKKPKLDPFKYVKQDTSTAFTSQQLVTLAGKMKEKSYAQLRGKEKLDIDKQLKKLDEPDTIKKKKAAYELSSSAMMLMGASQNKELAIVLASASTEIFPADGLLVSNFSALLRMLDSTALSLPVLVYAKSLAPMSPIVLTNLGNTLFELGDDRKAEVFFKRALSIDNHFRDARTSLVDVYLKRKELGKAYEELMKGVEEVTYTENTKTELAVTKNDPATKKQSQSNKQTPPPPTGPAASGSSSGGGSTPDQLKLPPFPDWSDLKAFMAAKGPGNWEKEINKGFKTSIDEMTGAGKKHGAQVASVLKLPRELQQEAMDAILNNPFAKMAERSECAMEIMQQYMDDRYDRILKDYSETEDKNGDKNTKSFATVSDAFAKHTQTLANTMQAKLNSTTPEMEKAASGQGLSKEEAEKAGSAAGETLMQLPEYQKLMVEYCRATKRLTEDRFADWKNNVRILHNKTNDLLMEYWVYCEQYLNQVYDEDYDRLNAMRMLYVYGKLSILSGTYTAMPLAFLTTAFGSSSGDCPDAIPAPTSAAGDADMNTTVPKKKGPPCPFDGKAKMPFFVGSIKFNCESVQIEAGEGLIGSVEHNFRKHTTTLGAYIGEEGEFGVMGASVKAGMTVTFDRNGQPTDGALVGEVIGNVIGLGGRSIKGTVAAVAGVDLEVEKEIILMH